MPKSRKQKKQSRNWIKSASKTSEQKQVLEKEKARHAALVAQLSDKLSNQKKEAERLAQDEKRLGGLVDRLSRKIEEQRKAAEKRAAPSTSCRTTGQKTGKTIETDETGQKNPIPSSKTGITG